MTSLAQSQGKAELEGEAQEPPALVHLLCRYKSPCESGMWLGLRTTASHTQILQVKNYLLTSFLSFAIKKKRYKYFFIERKKSVPLVGRVRLRMVRHGRSQRRRIPRGQCQQNVTTVLKPDSTTS